VRCSLVILESLATRIQQVYHHISRTFSLVSQHVLFNYTSQTLSLEQIELQAKLLKYFLGSNKSNINQNTSRTPPYHQLAHFRCPSMSLISSSTYASIEITNFIIYTSQTLSYHLPTLAITSQTCPHVSSRHLYITSFIIYKSQTLLWWWCLVEFCLPTSLPPSLPLSYALSLSLSRTHTLSLSVLSLSLYTIGNLAGQFTHFRVVSCTQM